jgi:hypothetical protein
MDSVQGNQIVQIFAQWVSVNIGQFILLQK